MGAIDKIGIENALTAVFPSSVVWKSHLHCHGCCCFDQVFDAINVSNSMTSWTSLLYLLFNRVNQNNYALLHTCMHTCINAHTHTHTHTHACSLCLSVKNTKLAEHNNHKNLYTTDEFFLYHACIVFLRQHSFSQYLGLNKYISLQLNSCSCTEVGSVLGQSWLFEWCVAVTNCSLP